MDVLVKEDEDSALVQRCRSADSLAFATLVTRYQRPLYNAAFRILGNTEDAKDVTQVVFTRVLERLDDYDPKYKFFSWIYRIALNESISLLRQKRYEEPIDDELDWAGPDSENPMSCLEARQMSDSIQRALMRMKHEDRVVLTLRHFSECSYQEMAEILHLEERTVKSRLYEARQRLAAQLKDVVRN